MFFWLHRAADSSYKLIVENNIFYSCQSNKLFYLSNYSIYIGGQCDCNIDVLPESDRPIAQIMWAWPLQKAKWLF